MRLVKLSSYFPTFLGYSNKEESSETNLHIRQFIYSAKPNLSFDVREEKTHDKVKKMNHFKERLFLWPPAETRSFVIDVAQQEKHLQDSRHLKFLSEEKNEIIRTTNIKGFPHYP